MKNKTDSPVPGAKPASKHFYSFQIKSRTLGCNLKEWLDSFSSANP